jgi:hypothetical protein
MGHAKTKNGYWVSLVFKKNLSKIFCFELKTHGHGGFRFDEKG